MELYTMNDRYQLNKELAQMLKGGVIMDVTTPHRPLRRGPDPGGH